MVGRQNVGKSTLVNRLAGGRRGDRARHARRHPRPARDRDVVARSEVRPDRHRRLPARGEGRRGARARPGRPRHRARRRDRARRRRPRRRHRGGRRARAGGFAASTCRSCSSPTRSTPSGRSPTRPRSTRSGSASRSRSRRCTGELPATCSTASWTLLPDAPDERDERRRRAEVRPRGTAERRQVEPVQSSRRRGAVASCSRRRARPGTRSTRVATWPDGPVRFVDTAGMRRANRARGVEYYSCGAHDEGDRTGRRRHGRDRRGAGLRGRGQEDRERRPRGGTGR